LRFVPEKHRKQVARDLRPIYTAVNSDAALAALESFERSWGLRYPMIGSSWRDAWEQVIPFLSFPPDVRRIVYTTNAIEALHRQVRKTIKTRGHFPTEDAARKLIYLSIVNAQRSWRKAYNWNAALVAFKIHFGDRLP
jgi:putative transposase